MLFAGPIAGWIGTRVGSRLPMLLGCLLAAASFGLLAVAHERGYTAAFALSAIVLVLAFCATLLVPVRARVHTRVPA
jgi:MFS family permease